jgi:hypothetical protein
VSIPIRIPVTAQRFCAWCEDDISGVGEAIPIMYARWGGPDDNWQCSDWPGCRERQAILDDRTGLLPVSDRFRIPIAAIESAG